jgi:hypothetical protein
MPHPFYLMSELSSCSFSFPEHSVCIKQDRYTRGKERERIKEEKTLGKQREKKAKGGEMYFLQAHNCQGGLWCAALHRWNAKR